MSASHKEVRNGEINNNNDYDMTSTVGNPENGTTPIFEVVLRNPDAQPDLGVSHRLEPLAQTFERLSDTLTVEGDIVPPPAYDDGGPGLGWKPGMTIPELLAATSLIRMQRSLYTSDQKSISFLSA